MVTLLCEYINPICHLINERTSKRGDSRQTERIHIKYLYTNNQAKTPEYVPVEYN